MWAGGDKRDARWAGVRTPAEQKEPFVENVVFVSFDDPNAALKALTELLRLHDAEALKVHTAAVVERRPDGTWRIADETEHPAFGGTLAGGLVGALVGALTGPVGLLLGATAGLLAGELVDVNKDEADELILEAMIGKVPPGTTALLAEVDEPVPDTLDAVMQKLGGRVTRWPRKEVEAELEAAAEADEANRRETRRIFHRWKEKTANV
jgi:uncharacterized membrane protein